MIRAIIVEDEGHCIDRLNILLQDYCTEIKVEAIFSTVDSAFEGIQKLHPEVIFLDVRIQDSTGFDLVKRFERIEFEIIFTTAYEQFAIQAFKCSAVDYLLKPVDPFDLQQAVQKLKGKLSKEETGRKMDVLLHNLQNLQGLSRRINIPTVNGLTFLNVNEIIRCEAHINYTTIHLANKEKHTVAKTLKEFEEILMESNFFRIHNSHLVNLAYIKTYHKGKGGYVQMTDNSQIEVSTRRKDEFLKRLANA